jgi:hypothetical protein
MGTGCETPLATEIGFATKSRTATCEPRTSAMGISCQKSLARAFG